jgi:hypothetical protein
MWVVGYDPADTNALLAGGLEHWLRRHGSPFHSESSNFTAAHWIPIKAIPGLRDLATSSDLILVYAPDLPRLRRERLWTSEDPPTPEIRRVLNTIDEHNALLSIEFTYNMDFGSNTIARANNVIQPALKGVPSFITMPSSAVALRNTGRQGNRNETQQDLESICLDACKSLVSTNTPVNYGTVSEVLGRSDLPIDTINDGSWKMDLMMAVVGDTWNVAASVINLDESVVYFPDKWKMSGCQLGEIYDLISKSIELWLNEGRRLQPTDEIVRGLRKKSEEKIARLGPPLRGGRRSRNLHWDEICQELGYPEQSRSDFTYKTVSGLDNKVRENHHTLLSPELTIVNRFDMNDQRDWQNWALNRAEERTEYGEILHNRNRNKRLAFYRYRDLSEVNVDAIPPEIRKRQVIATLNIADHTARGNAPLHQNLIERTYLGRAEMMDLVNFREYVGSEHRMRAVANSRSRRRVVFALDLPINSTDFSDLSQSNANISLWYKMADLYILEDGLFLGREWTGDGLLRLA